jgi:cellulose synthase (UDP-forming)
MERPILIDTFTPKQKLLRINKRNWVWDIPHPNKSILVDILNRNQKLQLNFLLAIWSLTLVLFYTWWCWPSHISNPGLFLINTFVISWPLLMPGYAFYFVRRMKKPNFTLGVPKDWRVAMIVTKAPSEPWIVVKRTLTGMLNEKSHPHDTWLADEDPADEIRTWCTEHGVKISCRKGIPEYNNLDFPRRMRCKEGNLAYFYDTWGYRDYDFVAQFDSDHMPLPGYLRQALVAFHNPDIGYVTAPSVCDVNAKESWVARARLWVEAILHGTMQAGCHGDWAPMCIGSHFTVRTTALKDIGGLGPELAEDHSTTFLFCAAGWKGVHAIDALASGRGPESFKDGMVQELQWSRSLVILFLTMTPKHIHKFPLRLAFQFLFSQLWYFLYTIALLGALLISPIALVAGQAFMNINFWDFLVASTIPSMFCVLVVFWLKHQKLLRPVNAKIISWEAALFPLARWPIVLWAIIDAFKITYFRKRRIWKVTPKKKEDNDRIPMRFCWPYLSIIITCLSIELFFYPNGSTFYYYIFNFMNCLVYAGILALIYVFNKIEAAKQKQRKIAQALQVT